MNKMDRNPDPIPEEFPTDEAAAEFWDTHSVAGYEESLEPVDVDRTRLDIMSAESAFHRFPNCGVVGYGMFLDDSNSIGVFSQ
ncbi:MAG: hypothetical protein KC964_14830 [Candidatus Omnitrophica bacterium]|nr:hypothetical protein [Candidatus Omnitrophota bacterium]